MAALEAASATTGNVAPRLDARRGGLVEARPNLGSGLEAFAFRTAKHGWPLGWPDGWPEGWPDGWPVDWPDGWPLGWPDL